MSATILALTILASELPVRVVNHDADTPVAAYVVAWEQYHWTGFHSSGDTCFRAAAARIEQSGGNVTLPSVSADTKLAVGDKPRRIESLTFAPGHCAVTPFASRLGAGFTHWKSAGDAGSVWGFPEGMRPAEPATIRARASNEVAEHRLLYLLEVARVLTGICSELADRRFTDAMGAAILDEAQSLPRTFHERFLLQRIRETLLQSPERSFVFNPLMNAMTMAQGNVGRLREILEWTRASPTFEEPWCRSDGRCTTWQQPKNMFTPHEPFQIDLRADSGRTALMEAAQSVNLPAMRFLLEQGASPNVLTQPGGLGALDLLLLRAERDVNRYAPDGVESHLLRALDVLLAAHPTLHAANRRSLSRQQEWKLDGRPREFWTKAAEKLASTPGRAEFIPACTARAIEPQTMRLGAQPLY